MKKYISILVLTIMILGCSRNYDPKVVVEGKLPEIGKMMFLDSLTGYAIGYDNQKVGHLIITTDGGKTKFMQVRTPLYSVVSFSFINKDCGWISGVTGIFHTTDGGG